MESAPQNFDGEDDDNLEGTAADQAINSSCSYEDIDTEVIREMDLSRATKHPTQNEDKSSFSPAKSHGLEQQLNYVDSNRQYYYDKSSNSCARGAKHTDSLKTSTVFEELAPGRHDDDDGGLIITTTLDKNQSPGSFMGY